MVKDYERNLLLFSPKFIKQKEYWVNKLSQDTEKTGILFTGNKNQPPAKEIDRVEIMITDHLFERLMKLSNRSDLAIYIILLTGLKSLIYRYTGSNDIMVVSPVYTPNETEETINDLLFIRDVIDDKSTFKELLQQISQSTLNAYENQDYPFDKLLEYLYDRSADENVNPSAVTDIECSLGNIHRQRNPAELQDELIFRFIRQPDQVEGEILYNSRKYGTYYLEQISRHFVRLLDQFLLDVETTLSNVSFLTEREQLLYHFNRTEADYPGDNSIHRLFEQQVEQTPDNTAVVFEDRALSYSRLNSQANRLAGELNEKGATPGSLVGIIMNPSPGLVIGILGILKSGAAYLPIDRECPPARKAFMIKDSGIKILLTQRDFPGENRELLQLIPPGHTIVVDDCHFSSKKTSNPDIETNSRDICYVMYTSGTTGNPKGVVVEHRGVVNYIWWAARTYVRGQVIHFPLYTSIAFDLTVTSVFTPLITGNAVVVYKGEDKINLVEKIIDDNRVGAVKLTPTHLKLIRDKKIKKNASNIKRFILGGEELETKLAKDIFQNFNGDIEIYNEYGPTETVVGCMIYRFNPEDDELTVPIGNPIDNTRIYILDRNLNPLPFGAGGELCIGGDGVARGYFRQEALTAEKFIPDPFIEGGRLYRSGDLARRLPDGTVEFSGRIDNQVKIRGYRIELGEIEARLRTHEKITDAIVIAAEKSKGNSRGIDQKDIFLYAYIVSEKEPEAAELEDFLARHLPGYMIPSYFVQIEKIPLTANGKIDHNALPEPGINTGLDFQPPTNEIELKLVDIWSDVLYVDKEVIGIDANFFRMGGHSLKAAALISNIHKKLKVTVPLKEIFNNPTIRQLSGYIKTATGNEYCPINATEKKEYYEASYAQKRLWVLSQSKAASLTYNIPGVYISREKPDIEAVNKAFSYLIERHESLRTVFLLIGVDIKQKVVSTAEINFKLEYTDVRKSEDRDRDKALENLKETEKNTPFDLVKGPLLRAKLIHMEEKKCLFLFTIHHIISDYLSMEVLRKEFLMLYECFQKGEPAALNPLKTQYRDYTDWQHKQLTGNNLKRLREYWQNRFKGKDNIPRLELPYDKQRPEMRSYRGETIGFKLNEDIIGKLKSMGDENDVTLFMVLLSSVIHLLYYYGGQQDIIIGTPIAGREHADLENQIGFYINTLALRTTFREDNTFLELLDIVKKVILEAYEHQLYPFDQLVEELGIELDMSRHPLFDVMVDMVNLLEPKHERAETEPGKKENPLTFFQNTSKFDLTIFFREEVKSINVGFEYNTALFERKTIIGIVNRYQKLLERMIEDFDQPISCLQLEEEIALPAFNTFARV